MSFTIAHISDTHLSGAKPFFLPNFERVARHVRAGRPDLVVHTGDVTLDGASQEDDLAAALEMHGGLAPDLRFIPGNHDLGESQEVPSDHVPPISAELRRRYLDLFGPDYWLEDVPGWRLLGINAQMLGSDLSAAGEQLRFIAAAVAGAGSRQIALFVHKPLFHLSSDEQAVTGRFVNPEPRRALLQAFGGRRPALVASGHVHQYASMEAEGMHCVWAPATAFILPDARQPRYGLKQVGYAEHTLMEDGGHLSRFVAVPELENLDISHFPEAYGAP